MNRAVEKLIYELAEPYVKSVRVSRYESKNVLTGEAKDRINGKLLKCFKDGIYGIPYIEGYTDADGFKVIWNEGCREKWDTKYAMIDTLETVVKVMYDWECANPNRRFAEFRKPFVAKIQEEIRKTKEDS